MISWTLELDGRPPSANKQRGRNHRMETARETSSWRTRARVRYTDARNKGKAPSAVHAVSVTACQMSQDRRWLQDIGACMPAVKAVIDGFVDGGLIPDDTPEHLRALTFLPPDICGRNGLRVVVYVDEEAA